MSRRQHDATTPLSTLQGVATTHHHLDDGTLWVHLDRARSAFATCSDCAAHSSFGTRITTASGMHQVERGQC